MRPSANIRRSTKEDIPSILEIFKSAKQYMRLQGHKSQWGDQYPGEKDIEKDIENGVSFVGIDGEGGIFMTFAFVTGEDPTYKKIWEGEWLNDSPYGTIHRIASNGKSRGVLQFACDYCFEIVDNLRIDTHKDNKAMLKALNDLEFKKCGVIICRDGSPRVAFQKCKVTQ